MRAYSNLKIVIRKSYFYLASWPYKVVIHLQYWLDQYFFLNIYSQSGNIATVLRNSENVGYLSSKRCCGCVSHFNFHYEAGV